MLGRRLYLHGIGPTLIAERARGRHKPKNWPWICFLPMARIAKAHRNRGGVNFVGIVVDWPINQNHKTHAKIFFKYLGRGNRVVFASAQIATDAYIAIVPMIECSAQLLS